MTVAEIIEKVQNLAHDKFMPREYIYDFINMALQDIEARGDYNWQLYQETLTIPAGTTDLPLTKNPVKRIISINPETELSFIGGTPKLKSAPEENLTLTITYTFKHPSFDGADINKIIPDDWLYILGGTFYALVHNQDPAAPIYQQKFYEKLDNHYEENAFIAPIEYIEAEIGGI